MKRPFILILLITLLFSVAASSNRDVLGQSENDAAPQGVETNDSVALEILFTKNLELVWNDIGSGGDYDGSYWRPKELPAGYYALGHNGQAGYLPKGGMYLARELESGALAAPVDYSLVWYDVGSGANMDGSFWKPIPPSGYVCLGLVAQGNHGKPNLDQIRCVREDLAAPGKVGDFVWNDKGTGADYSDFGSWHIVPKDENGISVGAFTGHQSHNLPDDSGLFVLDSRMATIKDSAGKYLAIVDVYITNKDDSNPVPPSPEYTGVAWRLVDDKPICTVPFVPGLTSTYTVPDDINYGIGGHFVYIWVKYDWVAATDDTPVLVDLAVHHWPNWNVDCPSGWEAAHGDIGGALTTQADNACWRNGLCVRYKPMNETETFISNLSLSLPDSEATLPALCPANDGYWPMKQDDLDIHMGCGDGNWMFLGYNQARKWPAMPASLPTPSSSDKRFDLSKYAPRVWLADYEPDHPEGEIYFPSSVEWSFEHLNRIWYKDRWWLATKEGLDSPSDVLPYFHGCDGTSTNIPCDLTNTPVYAFWDKVKFDVSGQEVEVHDLIYFMYYPYNRGKELVNTIWGNHVGDWEHVSVRLTPQWDEQNGWSLRPAQIYLSAHDFGRAYLWDEIDKAMGDGVFLPTILAQEGSALHNQSRYVEQAGTVGQTNSLFTHPVVYAAWGAHGNWRDPGAHVYQHTPVGVLVDYTGQGTAWETWRSVVAFDYDTQSGLGGSTWPEWMRKEYTDENYGNINPASGPIFRWGNDEWWCDTLISGYCRLENGPTGPVDKGVWDIEILR